jgi:hypothetical protein
MVIMGLLGAALALAATGDTTAALAACAALVVVGTWELLQ